MGVMGMATFRVKMLPTLDDEKRMRIEAVKREAHSILAQTDWYIVRHQETGAPIPQAVLDYRAAVRAATDRAEQEIAALDSVEAVRAYWVQWPPKPEGIA